jgi:predicted transglutaminase-like cysteine proteinase
MSQQKLQHRLTMFIFIRNWLSDQTTYRKLSAIKSAVDKRITYKDTGQNVWRYVYPTERISEDCQAFAETYWRDCINNGFINASKHVYNLPDGKPHAVCVVYTEHGDYVLDCMIKKPYKA